MKRLFITSILAFSSLLHAEVNSDDIDGYEIFKRDCNQCHIEMISKEDTMKGLKTGKVIAPPMVEVAKRIQKVIQVTIDNEEARNFIHISFIKAYLKTPSIFTSLCQPHAKEKFGAMPPQTQLTEAESQAVAEWILDRYEDEEF